MNVERKGSPLDPLAENEQLVRTLYRGLFRRDGDPDGVTYWVGHLNDGSLSPSELVACMMDTDEYRSISSGRIFAPPGHFYSPIVNLDEANRHLHKLYESPLPDRSVGINLDPADMRKVWNEMLPHLQSAPFEEEARPGFRYRYDNPAYVYGDGAVLHAMLRRLQPKRMIEVGSGWSSACTVDTIENDLDGKCHITFIEPYPDLLRNLMGDTEVPHKIRPHGIQDTPLEVFDELESGDLLFIDSTHILKTASDVWFELCVVLPRLKPGVMVHIHDIFWPFEYPKEWVIDENRSWNELYALEMFLRDNPKWKVEFFNNYFEHTHRDLVEKTFPIYLKNGGCGIWLKKIG